jgi:hypothetical protein
VCRYIEEPFQGNDATDWGSGKEDEALEAYKYITVGLARCVWGTTNYLC